jgi:glutamate:GABA antiporter
MHSPTRMKKSLGTLTLSAICIVSIINIREFPLMASIGSTGIIYYLLAALFFFVPSALVVKKLAIAHPDNGGIYSWVRKAFGDNIGLAAMWMEWVNNLISIPATLATIIAILSFIFFPQLMHNSLEFYITLIAVFWITNALNFFGLERAKWISIIGSIVGIILPSLCIIMLGIYWVITHHPIAFVAHPVLHHSNNSALFVSVLSSYAGIQVIAFYAKDVATPEKTFPRTIIYSAIAIFILSTGASLAIATIIPPGHVNYMNGVIAAFSDFLQSLHLTYLLPYLGICLIIAALTTLSTWLLALARGMRTVAEEGFFPARFSTVNRFNTPQNLLLLQGIIVTMLASVFYFLPHLQIAFWLLIASTSQFTMLVYILLFLSGLKLNKTSGMTFKITVCAGILCAIIGVYVSLFPPERLGIHHIKGYLIGTLLINLIILSIPFLLTKKPKTLSALK